MMKRLLPFCSLLFALYARAAVPTFQSFEPTQFQTNSFIVTYKATHTNDNGIIYPAMTNSLTLVTNLNTYGTFSLPSKVTLLALGTNYLDMSTNTTWLLNSPTSDATQVILSLSAGAYQGQLALLTSQNGDNAFTLPNQSEQWDVPGAFVWLSGADWIGTTNRGILLQYTAPDWVLLERFDPSGGGGGSVFGSGTANYIPLWTSGTALGLSPLYSGNKYTISLQATNDNVSSYQIVPLNTNVTSGFFGVNMIDSDGTSPVVWLNGLKGTGWALGTPAARDGIFSMNVLHDNNMTERFEVNDTDIHFLGHDGITANFKVSDTSGYTGAGTAYLSDDGTYKAGTSGAGTAGFLPYWPTATTFSISPIYKISTTALGFNSTNFWAINDVANLNVAIGDSAMTATTSGGANAAFGNQALNGLTTGANNVGIGYRAMYQLVGGSDNVAVGLNAGLANTASGENTSIGTSAGFYGTGSGNTSLGSLAGKTNAVGNDNIFIGRNANPSISSGTNEIVIGAAAIGNGSNTATIGAPATTALYVGSLKAVIGPLTNSFGIHLDGGGLVLATGVAAYSQIINGGTIQSCVMIADQTGSAVVDIWRCTYGQFDAGSTHPVAGDKITSSAPPTITSATKSTNALTGWSLSVTNGDVIAWSVTSCTSITKLDIQVTTTR